MATGDERAPLLGSEVKVNGRPDYQSEDGEAGDDEAYCSACGIGLFDSDKHAPLLRVERYLLRLGVHNRHLLQGNTNRDGDSGRNM